MPKFPDVNCDARAPSSIWHAERPTNPMLETQLVAPRKGAIRKFLTRLPMSSAQKAAAIASAPDRLVMREHIFPEVARRAGNILFVGTRAYTADYPAQFEEHGGLCWTIDRDAKAAPYGAAGRHVTGSVTEIDTIYPVTMFRTIVLTGVLGFGVNRFSDQLRALEACSIALDRGGTLVLGWNDRRLHPGVLEEAASRWFDFRDFGHLPSRIWVSGYDHNFAFLRRRLAVS